MSKKYTGYLGSYTKKTSEGIYRFTLDTEQKKITDVEVAAKLNNPTYVTVSQNNDYLYAVSQEGEEGGVAAFSIADGNLEKLNSEVTAGSPPCHVSVDSKNRLVVAANYHTKQVEAFQANEDGSLQAPTSVTHEGSGPHERQEKPHLHFAGYTPDEKYIVVVDLGSDTITTYSPNGDELEEVSVLTVKAGSGPRHIAFHPSAPYAYVMTELSNEVIVLKYDENTGTFEEVQYVATIPEDFTENNQGSAIHLSSDGKFVYAGNRGHDSIAVFRIAADYTVELVEYTPTEGNWPRDFVLDPSEQFIVAANQESSTLTLFERDSESGTLTLLQKDVEAPEAVCVKFLHA
ncbi:lactonase family protein [Oceanobacillus alkalisoli]|uniref:lactonase family protein n=1 Tax=Oceanobacillus alkalisoli TaxID=2925113 RepID=UPI001F119C57|nr:beta-propeller fold lactonase family protein [Oceanobacillus alkalisoli]MCF3942894.1 lactonase family protein [Oceanobacillus alkalisoli]